MADGAHSHIDAKTGKSTTGHEWDGIRELNTPLPRWWLWTFYACILWSVGYWIVYPAWPLVSGATQGLFGWHSRAAVVQDLNGLQELRASVDRQAADGFARRHREDAGSAGDRARAGLGAVRQQLRAVPRRGRPGLQGLSQPQRRPLAVGRHAEGDPDDHHAWRALGRRSQDPFEPDALVRQGRHPEAGSDPRDRQFRALVVGPEDRAERRSCARQEDLRRQLRALPRRRRARATRRWARPT